MTSLPRTSALADLASTDRAAIWLDDLSRPLMTSGELHNLITNYSVTGVTTNPTIFATAIADNASYQEQVTQLAAQGANVDDAIRAITTTDVASACDIFASVFEQTNGLNGRVSLEVDPGLAHDTAGTIEQAVYLHSQVNRPNVMIKVPATVEGLAAITELISQGISVNATLIFSLARHQQVLDAYLAGVQAVKEQGRELGATEGHFVTSFFVSRVDSDIDGQLDALGTEEARRLRGKAAIANACLAYQQFETFIDQPEWKDVLSAGAKVPRPLWASTGVKDPAYPDTMYVSELAAPMIVNTMPKSTLLAVADHGSLTSDAVERHLVDAAQVLAELEGLGINYDEVVARLEKDGVAKFQASWNSLRESVQEQLTQARA